MTSRYWATQPDGHVPGYGDLGALTAQWDRSAIRWPRLFGAIREVSAHVRTV